MYFGILNVHSTSTICPSLVCHALFLVCIVHVGSAFMCQSKHIVQVVHGCERRLNIMWHTLQPMLIFCIIILLLLVCTFPPHCRHWSAPCAWGLAGAVWGGGHRDEPPRPLWECGGGDTPLPQGDCDRQPGRRGRGEGRGRERGGGLKGQQGAEGQHCRTFPWIVGSKDAIRLHKDSESFSLWVWDTWHCVIELSCSRKFGRGF